MIKSQLQKIIENTVKNLCKINALPKEANSLILKASFNAPKDAKFGDYATNAALILAKAAKKPPIKVAQLLIDKLSDPKKKIKSAQIAGPGFLNFVISDFVIQNVIKEVLQQKELFGHLKKDKNKKVLIEYISANPTGPLHLGHARGAFMGDAIASILDAAGYNVTSEFYVNDTGNQVRTLARSIYARYQELFGFKVTFAKDAYPGKYLVDIAQIIKDEDGDKWLNKNEIEWLSRFLEIGIRENLNEIKATLSHAKIKFDNWFLESTLHKNKKVEQIIKDYEKLGMLYKADKALGTENKIRRKASKAAQYTEQQKGGTFLKTAQFGDEEDRILLKNNGEPVYLAADLAYHKEKFEREYSRIIDLFGADHAGHIPRIRAGMKALNMADEKLEFAVVQMVRLLRDGKEVRFSKRSGEIYLLSDLIDEVGADVARFIFLMRAKSTQFDFDLDLALKQSNDNPVFYVQYGHARMATLLKKAQSSNCPFVGVDNLKDNTLSKLILPEERNMLKKVADLGQVIKGAAQSLEPHRILYFCQELISEFHTYFTKYRSSEKIISSDVDLTQARLALVASIKQALANALSLLKISAPEHMSKVDKKE
ncbi:arginine--tRNA ligase [Sulfobacillus acidophilus]|uniref:Arginine--tRNA ligase n=1 Tax=Sulfobacillus acidophilus TaxID=53633 RepID=A0ABS3AW50_9FIRM|nr:arginine--tRNA ligase [Sulfobacillus acidophilus]